MPRSLHLAALLLLTAAPTPAQQGPGSLLGVSVLVDGRTTPLYPAPDGSGRLYLEARAGRGYEIRLENRTAERVGVALSVDGLDAISGELKRPGSGSDPGRMYVLDPWDAVTVRGWRTSLEEVRRFVFVDERDSYAVRSGQANGRLGWIEVAVHRESRPWAWGEPTLPVTPPPRRQRQDEAASGDQTQQDAAPPPAQAARSQAEGAKLESHRSFSHPGTGWGTAAHDPAVVVAFDPCPQPAERVVLRYEYAPALRRLGIPSRPWPTRDRLRERERGGDGFAKPPLS